MRRLTPNEKSLLMLLGAILFVGLNFFGYRALTQKETALRAEYAEGRADQAEARVSLQKEALWEKREAWIQQHEPTGDNEGDAKAQTLQTVLTAARGQGLEVLAQSLNDTTAQEGGFRVEVALTVKGSMESLTHWLTALQDPTSFYAVPFFSLKADNDQKAMVCTLHVYRYFRKA